MKDWINTQYEKRDAQMIKTYAQIMGVSASAVVRWAVQEFIENHPDAFRPLELARPEDAKSVPVLYPQADE